MVRYVYIKQFGGWWKATLKQWEAIVSKGLADESYELDCDARPLLGRPRSVKDFKEDGELCTKGTPIVHPLDWDRCNWECALKELTELRIRNNNHRSGPRTS